MSASAHKFTQYPSQHLDATRSRRILLVDEQAHVLRILRMELERRGYQVDMVSSADAALHQIRSDHYDALLITSSLPDMTAAQLHVRAAALLQHEPRQAMGEGVPAILSPDILLRRGSRPQTAAEVFQKPIDLQCIMQALDDVFPADERACKDVISSDMRHDR